MKARHGNKRIPEKYADVILEALTHYPELKNVPIDFCLRNKASVPYGTKPSFLALHKRAFKRKCVIVLLEKASDPTEQALFKNLSRTAQLGVLGHELNHVVQFNSCPRGKLMRLIFSYLIPAFKKKLERGADIAAIEHGLGKELYTHAVYIRSIPGYLEERKDIDKYYLKPYEILELMKKVEGFSQPQNK